MNKQSNSYTIIYSVALVLIVGITLSAVYQLLKLRQDQNIDDDKKKQILSAALISPNNGESISNLYTRYITDSFIVNADGNKVETSIRAFDVNVSTEIKKPENERLLPVYVCETSQGIKYIVPVYGSGLWGPIWGYVAFNDNGDSIYGAYFAHQGETPGLGAEIEKETFRNQFADKNIFNSTGEFESIAVVKRGQEPSGHEFVHAISGGTITSQGVQKMLYNSLQPYTKFFKTLKH